MALRWFGGPRQRPTPHEVPLEAFDGALRRLARGCDRVAVLGSSFGAEAALLTACANPNVDACIVFAPTSMVWSGYADGDWSSHWTRGGLPLPAIPFDLAAWPQGPEPSYLALYERSLRLAPAALREAATIPVEAITGTVIAVAGEDDQVWPSTLFAQHIRVRRDRVGLPTVLVTDPEAGHQIPLPGELRPSSGQRIIRGGSDIADRRLGIRAWDHIRTSLGLATA